MRSERNWMEKNHHSIVKILNKLAIIAPLVILGGALAGIIPSLTSTTSFLDYLAYIFGTLSGLILVASIFAIPASYLQTKYQPKKRVLTVAAVRNLTDSTAKQEERVADWLQNVAMVKDSLSTPSFFPIRLPRCLQKAAVTAFSDQKEREGNAMHQSTDRISSRSISLNIDF